MLGVVQAFLRSLEAISSSIEHLSITLSFPLDFVSKHNSIYARLKQRRSTFEGFSDIRTAVAQFQRIKSFSLEHERCVNDVPPEFCRSVTELSHFGVWKQSSPTLESLSIFGVDHSWCPADLVVSSLGKRPAVTPTQGAQPHERRHHHPALAQTHWNMINLPTDIVLCIVDYCKLHEICMLSLLNKATCVGIAPSLYRSVTLKNRKSIESFCGAIVNGRAELRYYPRAVAFSPKKTLIKTLSTLVLHIQKALGLMTSLVDLTLALPSKTVKAIFRDAHLSSTLRRLSCPLVAQTGFKRFLLEQSMIADIMVLGDVRGKINVGTLIRNPDGTLLPNLESVSANYDTLTALIPGRPLKHISTGSAILSVPHFQTFGATLAQSSTPIHSLGICISCAPFLLGAVVNHLIESLNENRVFPRTLSMTLVFPENTSTDPRMVRLRTME
ncbi:hypothetical protein RSOLAG1IB_12148 [Rhizoctonia solani AG-1 IB]|uniref:F-box domain-containing protein n=1 Tax=Thanatephorus cucumeris (strain AG1-IB / isolate 7/3/14) TaxID=1108050 RepID=A0A0B7FQV3_THACB|nr:hypothetical protein RSOLAG1IB_12148 [Rhizoctonia solani AG-1 IB]